MNREARRGRVAAVDTPPLSGWSVPALSWEPPDSGQPDPSPPTPPQLLCTVDAGEQRLLVAAGNGPLIRMWNRATGTPAPSVLVHRAPVVGLSVVVVSNRMLVASSSADGVVVVWDPATGAPVHTVDIAGDGSPARIADVRWGSLRHGAWPARPALLHLKSPGGDHLWDPEQNTFTPEPRSRMIATERCLTGLGDRAGWVTVGIADGRQTLHVVVQVGGSGEEWMRADLEVAEAVLTGWGDRRVPVLCGALRWTRSILLITRDVREDLRSSDLLIWWLVDGRATPLHVIPCDPDVPVVVDDKGYRPVLVIGTSPIRMVDPESGNVIGEYAGHEIPVDHISLLGVGDGGLIATGDRLGDVHAWERYGRSTERELHLPAPVIALAGDETTLFVAHGGGLTAEPLIRMLQIER